VEVTAKISELDGIKTQINKKTIKKENIDNQLAQATSDVYRLIIQGIYFMETLNQFNTKIYTSILSTKIIPMAFVNFSYPKDTKSHERSNNDETKEHPEEN
jgi:hypothetical protein